MDGSSPSSGGSDTGADCDIALALIFADSVWGSDGQVNYATEADNMLENIRTHDIIGATIYLYGEKNGKAIEAKPCDLCSRSIKNVRIEKVICSKPSAD